MHKQLAYSDCINFSCLKNEIAFDQVFTDAVFKVYNFRLRVKLETYNVGFFTGRVLFSLFFVKLFL